MRPSDAGTIAPTVTGSRSLGRMMWVPRLGRMIGTSASFCSSPGRIRSAHTPVALTTVRARTGNASPLSASRTWAPRASPSSSTRPVTSRPLANTAPKRSASPSTVSTSRTSSVWQS